MVAFRSRDLQGDVHIPAHGVRIGTDLVRGVDQLLGCGRAYSIQRRGQCHIESKSARIVRADADGRLDLNSLALESLLEGDVLDSAAKARRITGGEQVFRSGRPRTTRASEALGNGQIHGHQAVIGACVSVTAARGCRFGREFD